MEIGSIYEIDPKVLRTGWETEESIPKLRQVQKYRKKHLAYTASGREAIALALRSLEAGRPDITKKCLLPAYMCDTVFFPFIRAGWELSFYHIGKNLQADAGELRELTERIRPGLLFIHAYYGMDTWKPMRSLLKEWRGQGLCIMEDVTQSYYLEEAGRDADYVVGSLRKWYPVPDGGFVLSDTPLWQENLSADIGFVRERLDVLTDKWKYLHCETQCADEGRNAGTPQAEAGRIRKENYLLANRELENRLDHISGIRSLSGITAGLLRQTDEEWCRERRSGNCRLLMEGLSNSKEYAPVLPYQNTDAAPLYFPVYAGNREQLQEHLRRHDIYAPVLWPVGEANGDSLSADDSYLFSHLLALPMDQRYGKEEMSRIIEVMKSYGGR